MKLFVRKITSPIGDLSLVFDAQQRVRALEFNTYDDRLNRLLQEHYGALELAESSDSIAAEAALARYFSGDLAAIGDVPVATSGSELQRQVWTALREIPAGTVMTYGELASRLGMSDRRAALDVGAAIAANPIAIIVPCHRVVGKGGEMKGFAWGINRKRWLLAHEKAELRGPVRQSELFAVDDEAGSPRTIGRAS